MHNRIRPFFTWIALLAVFIILPAACNFPLVLARQTQLPDVLLTLPAINSTPILPSPTPPAGTQPLEATTPPELTVIPEPTIDPVQPGAESALSGKIVFACFLDQQDDICLLDLSNQQTTRLTDHAATDFYPSLASDGQTIVFSSNRDGNFEIFRMNILGENLVQLTDNNGDLYAPELSPDGQWIVFARESGGRQHIWRMRADGSEAQALTEGDFDAIDPSYSPDGNSISFTSNSTGSNQLYIMEWDGGNWRAITTDIVDMGGRNTWSADSQQLSFYAGYRQESGRNIYKVNVDGSSLQQLTDGGDNLGPSFSPDGQWIAFTSFRSGNNDIWVVRTDGSQLLQLSSDPRSEWQPRWGP